MNNLRGDKDVVILDEMSFSNVAQNAMQLGKTDAQLPVGLHDLTLVEATAGPMGRKVIGHMRTLLASLELQLNNPYLPVDRRNDAYAQYKSLRDEMRKAGIDVPDFKPAMVRGQPAPREVNFTLSRADRMLSFTERMRRKVGVKK